MDCILPHHELIFRLEMPPTVPAPRQNHPTPKPCQSRQPPWLQVPAGCPAAGNGIFGCGDRPQISPPKWVSAHRDKNPGNEWPKIPAERPYLTSYWKRAVCGDWMVEVVGHKLKTHHPVIEPVSDIRVGNGIFRCRDGGSRSAFCLAETDAETRTNSKKPAVHGTNARITRGVRYLKTAHQGSNLGPAD